jgi:uncharacterized protein
MNVLITGSSGLIGTALVRRLAADGHRVARLVRPRTTAPTTSIDAPPGTRPIDVHWDPSTGTIDLEALRASGPFDGVVHLAGAGVADKRWNPARKELILRSRTDSTELLAGSLLHLDPRPLVLVSASAIGIYGERAGETLTEKSPRGAGFLADVVEAWERAAQPAAEAGVRVVNLRTGLVLAASGGVLAKQVPLFRLGLGGRLGDGRQYLSWISLGDEVGTILHALGDSRLVGPVNATAPNPVTNAEFTSTLSGVLHRPSLLTVPKGALRVALGRLMADETALVSQRVVPHVLTDVGFTFDHPDLSAALQSILG